MTTRVDARTLASQFRRIEVELASAVPQALTLIAHQLATRAKRTRLFNDRTGALRASIRPGTVHGSLAAGFKIEAVAGGTGGVRYARFVHDGTRRMRARPFMAEAAEEMQRSGEMQRVLDQAVNMALQRAGF